MSERKVLNKYYPPDFDPTNIPRLKLPKTRQYTVRIMTPCNMKCNTCGDYIAKAKKFNARKETVEHETYLGLKIFRFYFKCPTCMAEITFKTDPKNCDYELEHGATRNFQALRMAEMQATQDAKDREEDEKLNPMKVLENRTKMSRREMDTLDDLEEIRDSNLRKVKLDTKDLLERDKVRKQKYEEMLRKMQEEEDEAELQNMLHSQNDIIAGEGTPSSNRLWVKVGDEQVEVEKWTDEHDQVTHTSTFVSSLVQQPEEVGSADASAFKMPDSVNGSAKSPNSSNALANSSNRVDVDASAESTSSKPPTTGSSVVKPDLTSFGAKKPESAKRKLAQLVKVVKKTKDDTATPPQIPPPPPKSSLPLCSYSDSDSD